MRSFRTALVTGATGFIGTALVRRLSSEQVKVICLVRSRQRAHALAGLPGVEILEVPSFQKQDLAAALAGRSADVVFHLASYGVQQDQRDLDQMIDGNVRALSIVLEATSSWKIQRFIHAGSCSEYAQPEAGVLIDESHPVEPTSVYGAAKAASFLFGNAIASRLGIPFLSLRLFGVYGPHEAPQRLVPYLLERLLNKQPVDLTPGEQVRDFLFEDDAVEAFIAAASVERLALHQAYNVCSSQPVSIRQIGGEIADALHCPRHLLHWGERDYRADEPMWLVGDNRRFVDATGWHPAISLEDGLGRMILSTQGMSASARGQHGI